MKEVIWHCLADQLGTNWKLGQSSIAFSLTDQIHLSFFCLSLIYSTLHPFNCSLWKTCSKPNLLLCPSPWAPGNLIRDVSSWLWPESAPSVGVIWTVNECIDNIYLPLLPSLLSLFIFQIKLIVFLLYFPFQINMFVRKKDSLKAAYFKWIELYWLTVLESAKSNIKLYTAAHGLLVSLSFV